MWLQIKKKNEFKGFYFYNCFDTDCKNDLLVLFIFILYT